ncbi:hypothetical protein DFH06DRAFT_1129506 [Mycena polygramma]|nr:hypothetical protein DFH06DRAFT_1129506 [Mycena polygramma]
MKPEKNVGIQRSSTRLGHGDGGHVLMKEAGTSIAVGHVPVGKPGDRCGGELVPNHQTRILEVELRYTEEKPKNLLHAVGMLAIPNEYNLPDRRQDPAALDDEFEVLSRRQHDLERLKARRHTPTASKGDLQGQERRELEPVGQLEVRTDNVCAGFEGRCISHCGDVDVGGDQRQDLDWWEQHPEDRVNGEVHVVEFVGIVVEVVMEGVRGDEAGKGSRSTVGESFEGMGHHGGARCPQIHGNAAVKRRSDDLHYVRDKILHAVKPPSALESIQVRQLKLQRELCMSDFVQTSLQLTKGHERINQNARPKHGPSLHNFAHGGREGRRNPYFDHQRHRLSSRAKPTVARARKEYMNGRKALPIFKKAKEEEGKLEAASFVHKPRTEGRVGQQKENPHDDIDEARNAKESCRDRILIVHAKAPRDGHRWEGARRRGS